MLRLRTPKQQTAIPVSLPAPIGGLNARDSVASMPETDALVMENFFPQETSVDLRKGYTEHATFTGICQTVIVYSGLTQTKIFVAVDTTNDAIIDATTGGAISTPVVGGSGPTVQAVTNTRYDYQIFGTTGGQFMSLVNGADTPLQYDGTTWSASTMTGLTTSTLFTNAVYAERLWFGQKNTFDVWYLPVKSITGALTRLNLGSLFKLGGSLSNIITWSADTSSELNDFIAFVSTQGEVIAYNGTDPSSAATWNRVAHFRIGRPVVKGNRCWAKFGSDAVIICADGLFPVSQAIVAGRLTGIAVSDKIAPLVNADVQAHGARFGWQVVLHPFGRKLLLNVPTNENISAYQWVMNAKTKAWCKFTGWTGFAWAVAQDTLYFGGNGFLAIADSGTDDDGAAITADCKQAFSYFGARGRQKQFTMARAILALDGDISLGMSLNLDYTDQAPTSFVPISIGTGDPWSVAWSVAWGGAVTIYKSWNTVGGIGFAAAMRIRVQAQEINLSWSATDIVFQYGGIL